MNRRIGLEFAPQQLPQPHSLSVVLFSLMSCKEQEEGEVINHHESLVQAEVTVGKGDRWEGCAHQDHAETHEHWKGTGTGQAGAWKDNLFLPQHLTLSLLCVSPSRPWVPVFLLSLLSFSEKRFPPQTPELWLCQDSSSSTALGVQLSLNTFNLPWRPPGHWKEKLLLCVRLQSPIHHHGDTFQHYGSPNQTPLQS